MKEYNISDDQYQYYELKDILKYNIDLPKKTSEELLDEIPLADIEKYLRKKKLENISK